MSTDLAVLLLYNKSKSDITLFVFRFLSSLQISQKVIRCAIQWIEKFIILNQSIYSPLKLKFYSLQNINKSYYELKIRAFLRRKTSLSFNNIKFI
jgi:hypothetical protein